MESVNFDRAAGFYDATRSLSTAYQAAAASRWWAFEIE